MHLLIPLLLPLIALTSATPLPGTPLESTPFDPIAPSTTPYAISLACGTCLLQPCFVATAQCIPLCASGNMGTGGGVFDQKRCRVSFYLFPIRRGCGRGMGWAWDGMGIC